MNAAALVCCRTITSGRPVRLNGTDSAIIAPSGAIKTHITHFNMRFTHASLGQNTFFQVLSDSLVYHTSSSVAGRDRPFERRTFIMSRFKKFVSVAIFAASFAPLAAQARVGELAVNAPVQQLAPDAGAQNAPVLHGRAVENAPVPVGFDVVPASNQGSNPDNQNAFVGKR